MNILITGYGGFIGKNLVSALSENRIIGVDLAKADLPVEHKNWSEIETIDNLDCVIHLAGIAHHTESRKDSSDYYEVNVGLTQKIFDHFLKSNAKKFIFFSSVAAVTDNMPKGMVLNENTVPNPQTHYGKSKLIAERYITNQNIPDGKLVYILRPSMVHGLGNKGNLPMLFKFVSKGFPWPLGGYENKRTFTYLGNLLFVVKKLIDTEVEPGTYQLADDESLSTNDLVITIMKSMGKPVRVWYIPSCFFGFFAKFVGAIGLPNLRFRLRKLTNSFEVSNKKIKDALGIETMPFRAIDGIRISIEALINDKK